MNTPPPADLATAIAAQSLELPRNVRLFATVSRKSALGKVPGAHAIVSAMWTDRPQNDDDPPLLLSTEVNDEEYGQAWAFARKVAIRIVEFLGLPPGSFRLAENGSGMARRPTFHIHILCFDPAALEALGLKLNLLVEPAWLFTAIL